jgi:hypothetical protein
MIPDLSANIITIVFSQQRFTRAFLCGGEFVVFHTELCCLDSGSNVHNHVSSRVMIRSRKSGSLRCRRRNAVDSRTRRFRSSSVRISLIHVTYANGHENAPQCSITAVGCLHNFFYGLPPIFIKARFDVVSHTRVDNCISSASFIVLYVFPSITKSLMSLKH